MTDLVIDSKRVEMIWVLLFMVVIELIRVLTVDRFSELFRCFRVWWIMDQLFFCFFCSRKIFWMGSRFKFIWEWCWIEGNFCVTTCSPWCFFCWCKVCTLMSSTFGSLITFLSSGGSDAYGSGRDAKISRINDSDSSIDSNSSIMVCCFWKLCNTDH